MTLRHYYRDLDGTLTDMSAFAPRLITTQHKAEEGAIGSWSVVLDDPDGELDIVGHRNWFIEDDESEDEDTIIFGGWTGGQTIARMQADAHRVIGPFARVITVELFDANVYLPRIVMNGSDTDRPAETDVERIQWLLSTDEADPFGDVVTYVATTGAINMDKAPLRGTYFGQIITDCGQASGKNFFAWYRKVAGVRTLTMWYGRDSLPAYPSQFYITNDPADINNEDVDLGITDVWPLSQDATMVRSPERQYCGLQLTYENGQTYRHNATTHALIAAGTHQHRHMTDYRPLIKTKTKAQARADRILLDVQHQDIRINTVVTNVRQDRVTLIKAGMLTQIKGTHWGPDCDEWHYARVVTAEPRPVGPGRFWDIPLELVLQDGEDGIAPGPPAPPYEGIVFAGLQRADAKPAHNDDLSFSLNYDDNVGTGWFSHTNEGPIAIDQGSPQYSSISVSEPMIVRLHAVVQFSTVTNPGTTVTAHLRVNGVSVASDSSIVPPLTFWADTLTMDLRDYHLDAGDVVSVTGVGVPGAGGWGNTGVNATFLHVTRGTIYSQTDGTSIVCEGP